MSQLLARMRPDLIFERSPGDDVWVVKDPVTLRYFHLRNEEYALLRMLDGQKTLEALCESFEAIFAPLKLTAPQLQAFIHRLYQLGLLLVDTHGQGVVLAQRSAELRWKRFLSAVASPLAIRWPGLPAADWMDRLYRGCRWLFSPISLTLCGLLVLSSACLLILNWREFRQRLPDAETFFAVDQGLWFFLVLIVVKCLHELGHGLALAHFGGKVYSVGGMLLVFSPALYCDVSDAWRLHPRWKRIVVSSAGMLVELVLAAVAVLLWRFSEPGLLQALALRVLFICTISTVLFNANPLIRGDGYYILSDLVNVPNLGQESRQALANLAGRWLLGSETADHGESPPWKNWALAAFGAATLLYGWILIGAVLWFLTATLRPQGLSALAWALSCVVIGGAALPPAIVASRAFFRPGRRPRMQRGRVAVSAVVIASVVLGLFLIPLPFSVTAPMWLEAIDPHNIYVTAPGTLQPLALAGKRVRQGEMLARLANPLLEDRRTELAAEVERHQARLATLKIQQGIDPGVGHLIPAEEKTLEDLRQRLQQAEEECERLILRAARAGVVIEPPGIPTAQQAGALQRLPTWNGSPLQPRNQGCLLEAGTLLCQVADPDSTEALVLIDQREIPWVRTGQRVKLWVEQGPARFCEGTIVEVARTNAADLPRPLLAALHLSGHDQLPATSASSLPGLQGGRVLYQARVAIEHDRSTPLRIGMLGRVKIVCDWQTMGQRWWRTLQQTFRFA